VARDARNGAVAREPAIVEQPVTQNMFEGDNVEFSVAATGTALTYQWKFNGSALNGATEATLTLPNVRPVQAGAYKVEIENAAGTASLQAYDEQLRCQLTEVHSHWRRLIAHRRESRATRAVSPQRILVSHFFVPRILEPPRRWSCASGRRGQGRASRVGLSI
jgi:hypothetical protein